MNDEEEVEIEIFQRKNQELRKMKKDVAIKKEDFEIGCCGWKKYSLKNFNT